MRKLNVFIVMLAVAATSFLASCSKDAEPLPSIVEIATGDDDFDSLVVALVRADLVDALSGDGPFTVFAPTNEAFVALLDELELDGIGQIDLDVLTSVLLFHVVSGKVESTDLSTGYVKTLNATGPGETKPDLYVDLSSGVKLNGSSNVETPDVMASNGVIHVIDAVMLPPSIVDLALSNSNFSILVDLLVRADLVDALKADGPFTVFAPTNAAFADLLTELDYADVDAMIADLGIDFIAKVLKNHVVSGANVLSSTLTNNQVVSPLDGNDFTIQISGSTVTIKDANDRVSGIVTVDVQGTNGVIHVINKVILPALS